MRDYFITYNNDKTVTITDISAEHARNTLKKTILNVTVINSTVIIPKVKKNGKSGSSKSKRTQIPNRSRNKN